MRPGVRSATAAIALALVAVHARAQAPVTDPRQIEARLARIERSLSSSSLLQMHQTMQGLEREVRELRGEIELQRHEIERLRQRQQDLFQDVDRGRRRRQAVLPTPRRHPARPRRRAPSPSPMPTPRRSSRRTAPPSISSRAGISPRPPRR